MICKTYHKVFNPTMTTIQAVVTDVDLLCQGWVLEKVIPYSLYEYVAVFVIKEEANDGR
jgi:hypothetical protein